MKVLYITNLASPYIVGFLNELGKHCELTAIFERRIANHRDASWQDHDFRYFRGIFLNGISFGKGTAICPQIVKYLNKSGSDYIIIANPTTPTGIMAIEYLKLRRIPFILQSEGGFAKNGKGFKERFKKHLMTGAKLYFSTTPTGDDYFLMYGAKKEKIVKYPFTSLYEKDIEKRALTKQEKLSIRANLGVKDNLVVLAVGRFIQIKGFDVLLKACAGIDQSVGIYIIGGNPPEEYLKIQDELQLNNVNFMAFQTKEILAQYYKMADLFVLPTREDTWGLVINEAMAYGLPVITTERCIAGLELVKNWENGFLVDVEDTETLARTINTIIHDDELRERMAENSLRKIRWYTLENMAARHIETLKELGRTTQ